MITYCLIGLTLIDFYRQSDLRQVGLLRLNLQITFNIVFRFSTIDESDDGVVFQENSGSRI